MKKHLTFENVTDAIFYVIGAATVIALGIVFYLMMQPPVTVSHCVVNSTSTEFVKFEHYYVNTTCGKFETDSHYNGMQVGHTYTITHDRLEEVKKDVEEN